SFATFAGNPGALITGAGPARCSPGRAVASPAPRATESIAARANGSGLARAAAAGARVAAGAGRSETFALMAPRGASLRARAAATASGDGTPAVRGTSAP